MTTKDTPIPVTAHNPTGCRNCHGLELKTLFEAPAFDAHVDKCFPVARCNHCGVVSTLDVSEEQLTEAYSTDYYGDANSKFSGLLENLLGFAAGLRAGSLVKLWQPATDEPPRVLDIGCGRGILLEAFRAKGAIVTGIERDTFPGRPDFVHIGSIKDDAFKGQQYDIVVIWHVLEHLTEIDDLMEHLRKHIAPDGLLVIAVPNFRSWQRQTFSRHWFHLDLPRHLLHIEPDWLRDTMMQHGFVCQSVNHFDLIQGPFGFIQSAMNALRPTANNHFYSLLKRQGTIGLSLIGWSLLAALLAPFALIESIYSSITRQGATFVMIAKPEQS